MAMKRVAKEDIILGGKVSPTFGGVFLPSP